MTLPVAGVAGLAEVVESLAPNAVVIAGSHLADDDVARWAYGVRAAAGALPVALFRRVPRDRQVHTMGARRLCDEPFAAHRQLLALVDEPAGSGYAEAAVRPMPGFEEIERREVGS